MANPEQPAWRRVIEESGAPRAMKDAAIAEVEEQLRSNPAAWEGRCQFCDRDIGTGHTQGCPYYRPPKVHELKTHPAPFDALWNGEKTAEFRLNDRDFALGDLLVLRRWSPLDQIYTGHLIRARVTHVGVGFGIPDGYVMLSLGRAAFGFNQHHGEGESA